VNGGVLNWHVLALCIATPMVTDTARDGHSQLVTRRILTGPQHYHWGVSTMGLLKVVFAPQHVPQRISGNTWAAPR
jgi:hypothetical protein